MTLNLYKVHLRCLWPNDNRTELTFWSYHMDESKARDAALLWGAKEVGDAAIVTIKQIDIVK